MFLLAVKTLAARVPPGQVHIVNDGSLTVEDQGLLAGHVPGVRIHALEQFRHTGCPVGGTWERLLAIAGFVKEGYVVQLDSDTLTLSDIPEISQCIDSQQGFTIATFDSADFESMETRQARASARLRGSDDHVQIVAEAHFDSLNDFRRMRYVRGCSGFAGFPPGSFDVDYVKDVSRQMAAAIGDKWNEWGSEQVMSNIVVANLSSARVLPHPKYADCLHRHPVDTAFVHFIGTCRFRDGIYAKLAQEKIRELT
ncbi:MAG: hypothetical protein ACLPXB_06220 [Thiobacillaceae bacterium]